MKMSDNIPFEMQVEIMKKLQNVKSLIQFRSVSKSWKHLIDSFDFITDYSGQHTDTHTQHLLIAGRYYELKYMLVADDDPFSKHKVHLLGNMFNSPFVIRLLCLVSKGRDGVCRETRDPKLVKIKHIKVGVNLESIDCIPSQVEVFTLSRGTWRSSYGNLPRKSICFHPYQVVTDGILYFLASYRNSIDESHMIVSFDLTSEAFREVSLPHSLAYGFPCGLSMSKLRESLVVFQIAKEDNSQVSVIWIDGTGFSSGGKHYFCMISQI